MLSHEVLRELATAEPERLVISVHARTDPREPANISVTPAWLIELRNGLRSISERLESGDDRESRLAFRALRARIEEELIELTPGERARSLTWILDADGTIGRFSLQLPLRRDRTVADTKPFVSPLVDIADRGAPVGVVLVGGDLIRIVQIEQAEATEPENSSFELSLGDWRPFAARQAAARSEACRSPHTMSATERGSKRSETACSRPLRRRLRCASRRSAGNVSW